MHSWKHSNYLLLIYQLHVSIRICYITCPTCSRALRVLVPHVSRVLCAFDLYVLSCPTCYRVPRSSCRTWYRTSCGLCPTCSCVSRASCFFFFFFFFIMRNTSNASCPIGLVSRALWALFPYVSYYFVPYVLYVLASPFVLLSFHASRSYFSVHFLLVIFWKKFTKVKTNIVCQYYFEVTISIYQQYAIF